ncbi:MAG TPA: Sec-independent protein translocase protein TatB [Gallionella sp.]|nr:Sec-independent protein translocase protein TatB [Gallionella sp.]
MFDFAFSELVVIMLVALVVIGPERLPKVARTAGHLWGRMQRYVHSVKNDIANDLAIEEAKQLHGSIRKEIVAIEQSAQDAKLTLEQKILQAQYGKSPEASDKQGTSVMRPPTTPSKPV